MWRGFFWEVFVIPAGGEKLNYIIQNIAERFISSGGE